MSSANTANVDPTEFVQKIRLLGEQRDQQDAERSRKLEDDILQGRAERARKRAERARSISPEKSTTPQSLRSSVNTPRSPHEKLAASPSPTMDPPSLPSTPRDDALDRLTGSSTPSDLETRTAPPVFRKPADIRTDELPEPSKPSPNPNALSRSGTLSWQRRPQSGSVRKPLSIMAAENNAARSPQPSPDRATADEQPISRDKIAQSLGAKDPSWFKQTPDRGIGSAAYRKSQDSGADQQEQEETARPRSYQTGSLRRQLPGMSRDSTVEPEGATSPPPDSVRSSLNSRDGSIRGSAGWSNRLSATTAASMSTQDTKSPLPTLESQRFSVPGSDQGSTADNDQFSAPRGLAMSPTQGRLSPERSPSPTKGMGGFVQSAMLKRSDSVSKRWSAQAPPGLSRRDSTASNRGSVSGLASVASLPRMDATRSSTVSRDTSLEPGSRPASSHSNATITQEPGKAEAASGDGFVKPSLRHARSKSVHSPVRKAYDDTEGGAEASEPQSPSKRWSPTKSSWLENALNRPASPTKQAKAAPPQQPSWMADLAKAKQQRMSVDISKNSPSSPGVSAPLSLGPAFDEKKVEETSTKDANMMKSNINMSEPTTQAPPPKLKPAALSSHLGRETPEAEKSATPINKAVESSTAAKASPNSTSKPALPAKPETPGKIDFRASLRSRQPLSDSSKQGNLEFQSVFGKLKKSQTEKFVAPDTFRNNIMQGKAALNVTGGPAPRVKRDELKEDLLRQKEVMKAKVAESGSAALKKPEAPASEQKIPEALARRKTLSRHGTSGSISSIASEKSPLEQPEALLRQQSLRDKPKPTITDKPMSPPQTKSPPPMLQGKLSGKLAERFNPALAGMLARGPSPIASGLDPSKSSRSSANMGPSSTSNEPTGEAKTLTHMTKGRAKGPKRRAPTSKAAEPTKTTEDIQQPIVNKESFESKSAATEPRPSSLSSRPIVSPKLASNITSVPLVRPRNVLPSDADESSEPLQTPTKNITPAKPKPVAPAKSPELFQKARTSVAGSVHESAKQPKPSTSPSRSSIGDRFSKEVKADETPVKRNTVSDRFSKDSRGIDLPSPTKSSMANRFSKDTLVDSEKKSPVDRLPLRDSQPPAPVQRKIEADSANEDTEELSVKNRITSWGRQPPAESPRSAGARSPIKLPTRKDEQEALINAGLASREKDNAVGLGIKTASTVPPVKLTEAPEMKRRSLKVAPSPLDVSTLSPNSAQKSPSQRPNGSSEAMKLFGDRFDIPPDTSGELPSNIDTQVIINSYPVSSQKIKTLRAQIQEITGDGKLNQVPIHEERIFFDESLYLITHIFGSASGAKTAECYLWAGSAVPESNVEDAQLFARKAAKENQATLINIRQGKETPNFFEALGGILITRRGSKPASKQYMLCGRRHIGHLVFDEVDLSLKNLCSGFSFILSAEKGPVFVWKGKGCNAEEISGARLIGMDVSGYGELVELEEGRETPAFLALFPATDDKGSRTVPRSAEHWRYKASSDRYRTRLFRIEQHTQQARQSLGGLQVSSFWPSTLLRRPSWQNFVSNVSPTLSPQPSGNRSPSPSSPSMGSGRSDLSPANKIETKVVEIAPFTQSDLEAERVYVLDAYFDIYIIVGALSRDQSHAFSTALLFAHEYGILAASSEDRPFVPVSTVVLEGVPKDMKAVFRHWREIPDTAALMAGKPLSRGRSLRIVGLGAALKATGAS